MSLKKADWEKIGHFFGVQNPEKATIKDIEGATPRTRTEALAYLNGLTDDDPCMDYFDSDLLDEVYPIGPNDPPSPWIIPARSVEVEVVDNSNPPDGVDPHAVLGQMILLDQIKIDKVPVTLIIHQWEPNIIYAKAGLLDPGFGSPCTWSQWVEAKKSFGLQLALRMFGDNKTLPDFCVHEEATYREATLLQKLKGRITSLLSREIGTMGYYQSCFTSDTWAAIDLFRLWSLNPDAELSALSPQVDGAKMRRTAMAIGGTALIQQTTALQKAVKASLALR